MTWEFAAQTLVLHSGVMYSGVMSETYYRLHHEGTPCFCADHAWSAVWGAEFVAPDGSQYRCTGCVREPGRDDAPCPDCYGHGWPDCTLCDGTGHAECGQCDGTGIADADRGYSCCASASALVSYFRHHLGEGTPPGWVIVFEGQLQGYGTDEGEHLVVPTQVLETLTWDQLVARAAQEEEAA